MKRIMFIPAQVKTAPDDGPDARPRCGEGVSPEWRLGVDAFGAVGSGRRRQKPPPPARGVERQVARAVTPSLAGGRPLDEQRGGACRTAWSCPSWSRRKVAHPPRGIAPSEIRPDFPNRVCDGCDCEFARRRVESGHYAFLMEALG